MSSNGSTARASMRRAAMIATICLAAACTPITRYHGFVPFEEDLAAITVGVDTRETITQTVGPPTSGGVLGEDAFYYVASTFRHYGAFAPQEIDRQVLAISFDAAGTVRNIERFTLTDGRVVALSRRVTDDGIEDVTFIGQLLGTVGNIDAEQFLGEN